VRFPLVARGAAAVLAAVAPLSVAAGCGAGDEPERDGLAADTAAFTYGGRTATVPLTACGREGDVVVLAGRRDAVVVQAEADLGEGGFDRTGVTADLGDEGILGAFGADLDHGPAGDVTDVRVEGDRLIVEATWVALDDDLAPVAGSSPQEVEGRLEARCPETAADGPEG
jgi:hypothetical protein